MFSFIKDTFNKFTGKLDHQGGYTSKKIEKAFEIVHSGAMIPPDHPAILLIEKIHQLKTDEIDTSNLINIETIDEEIDLTGSEVSFLKYLDGRNMNDKSFPKYWTYDHRLGFNDTIIKLYKYNYITYAGIETKLNTKTVAELKDILQEYELMVSGRKQELIDRLHENVSEKNLDCLFTNDYFEITEKGLLATRQYDRIKNKTKEQINEETEYLKTRKQLQNKSIDKYRKKIETAKNERDYNLVRRLYFNLYNVYKQANDDEGKLDVDTSILVFQLYDGMFNYLHYEEMGYLEFSPEVANDKNTGDVGPGIFRRIGIIQRRYDYTDEYIYNIIWDKVKTLPFHVEEDDFKNRLYGQLNKFRNQK